MTLSTNQKSLDGHRVYSALLTRITSGDYPPGVWLPTERALSEEFAVNRTVIRNVFLRLEQEGRIAREPGRRPWVQPAGLQRGAVARPRISSRDLQILVAILPQHPVYHASSQILNSINLELRTTEAPLRLMVFNSHGETIEEGAEFERRALLAVQEEEKIAGVIIWHTGGEATLPYLIQLREQGVAVVFVDRYPPALTCDYVGVDNRDSAAEAVRYLLSLGHRRIAHLTTSERATSVLERREGYLDALRSAGITPRPEWVYTGPEVKFPKLRPAVDQFFGQSEPPTAVFALNDALAHYFITEVEAAGYTVPESISVMGFDDLERYSPRPALLTTMHQPFDRIGQRATQLLLHRLSRTDPTALPSQHILLPAPLVVRSTCQPVG